MGFMLTANKGKYFLDVALIFVSIFPRGYFPLEHAILISSKWHAQFIIPVRCIYRLSFHCTTKTILYTSWLVVYDISDSLIMDHVTTSEKVDISGTTITIINNHNMIVLSLKKTIVKRSKKYACSHLQIKLKQTFTKCIGMPF